MAVAESSDLINFILFIWVMRDQKCLYIAHEIGTPSYINDRDSHLAIGTSFHI